MTKRAKYSGNQCFLCGRQCVPATDNDGQPYMGCPVCRFSPAPTEFRPSRADVLVAQLTQAQAEIAQLRRCVEAADAMRRWYAKQLGDGPEDAYDQARAEVEEKT